ncbi:MAG: hypothetical protein AAGH15_18060, partial [Myxococcota bacterium]
MNAKPTLRTIALAALLGAGCQRTVFVADDGGMGVATDASTDAPARPTPPPLLRETVPESPGASGRPDVVGLSEPGAEVALFRTAACEGEPAITVTSDGTFRATLEVPPNAFVDLSARATLPGQLPSVCSNALTYLWDAEGPTVPELLGTEPASPAPDARITLEGRAEPEVRVEVFQTADCTGPPLAVDTDAAGAFALALDVPRGDTTLSALALDALGNASACSAPLVHTRVLGVVPVFPPTGGATELDALLLRARLDVSPEARVSFEGPTGRREATYDADRDTWEARMPLTPGAQAIEVVLDAPEGTARAPLAEVARVVFPREPSAIAWDDATGVLLLGERGRVLAFDPASGDVSPRVDARGVLEDIVALTAAGGTLYLLGNGPDGLGRVASWDGTTLRERAALGVAARAGSIFIRAGGAELLLLADVLAGALRLDLATDTLRPLVDGPAWCLGYEPARDRAVLCRGEPIFGPIRLAALDLASDALTALDTGTDTAFALRRDVRRGGFLLVNADRALFRLDVDAGTVTPLFLDTPVHTQFVVRPDTGELVFVTGADTALPTLDLGTGLPGRLPVAPVGDGEPLGTPLAVAHAEGRVFLSDGPRVLEVTLGGGTGTRRRVASGGRSAGWQSLAFASELGSFFA